MLSIGKETVDDKMISRFQNLIPKDQKGSRARCIRLTTGNVEEVASRLSWLIEPYGRITKEDFWKPKGCDDPEEAMLHNVEKLFPNKHELCVKLLKWWIKIEKEDQKTPAFDIVSTCNIGDNKGLLLVEAKAHECELLVAAKGKDTKYLTSNDSFENHIHIGNVIAEASAHLQRYTATPWAISRDRFYQMSNRFAWAWKIAEEGIPVVIVYLGFINAKEMVDKIPFRDDFSWRENLYKHADGLVPLKAWEEELKVGKATIRAIIRSADVYIPAMRKFA